MKRVTGVSEPWLQSYVNDKHKSVSRQVKVRTKKKGKLTFQCDEIWSFVGNKDNKQWIWLAKDLKTREIIGVHVGLPAVAMEQESFGSLCHLCIDNVQESYSDFWEAYEQVIPSKRDRAVGKVPQIVIFLSLNSTFHLIIEH